VTEGRRSWLFVRISSRSFFRLRKPRMVQYYQSKGASTFFWLRRCNAVGCPPGIRTPIERVRVASPTIERGGNRLKGAADDGCWLPFRVYEVRAIRSTRGRVFSRCVFSIVSDGLEAIQHSQESLRTLSRHHGMPAGFHGNRRCRLQANYSLLTFCMFRFAGWGR
jgi:hypothetical protein